MDPIETPDQDAEPPHLSERGRQNLAWARSLAGQARHDRDLNAERDHLHAEVERWKKQAEQARAEADHLREQLDAAQAAARRVDVASREKAARLSVLQQELSDNDRRIEELQDRLAHASLHGRGGPAEEKIKELSERLAAAAGEAQALRVRLAELEARGAGDDAAAQRDARALEERRRAVDERERAIEERENGIKEDFRRKQGELEDLKAEFRREVLRLREDEGR